MQARRSADTFTIGRARVLWSWLRAQPTTMAWSIVLRPQPKEEDAMKTTTMRLVCAMLALFALTACGGGVVISDLETDKVIVQAEWPVDEAKILAEARRGCAMHGRVPKPISYRDAGDFLEEHLFACVEE